jgi:exopolysaccharide biosynthesis protein
MRDPLPEARAGALHWTEIAPGFEVAELPVLADGVEADRIMLAKIDPALFRFSIRNDPKGAKRLDDWMSETGAALIVNGSYFGRDGKPSTPVVSDGRSIGPQDYESRHGAFVAADGTARVKDLAGGDWRGAFHQAEAGMVSYPLLIAPDGSTNRTPKGSKWLANRSFIAEDQSGRIIVGTTAGAFFSLDRFAEFLKGSPLNLVAALNLDGGPVACQGVRIRNFERKSYGRWELQVQDSEAKILPPQLFTTAPMPIVLAVFSRN